MQNFGLGSFRLLMKTIQILLWIWPRIVIIMTTDIKYKCTFARPCGGVAILLYFRSNWLHFLAKSFWVCHVCFLWAVIVTWPSASLYRVHQNLKTVDKTVRKMWHVIFPTSYKFIKDVKELCVSGSFMLAVLSNEPFFPLEIL